MSAENQCSDHTCLQGMTDDPVTVEQFCRRYVEPMGEESDHIHIVAITDALQVCIQGYDLLRTYLAVRCLFKHLLRNCLKVAVMPMVKGNHMWWALSVIW